MITIVYCEDGVSVSDFELDDWAYKYLLHPETKDATYRVSTGLPIHYVQLLIARGKLNCEDIVFSYPNAGRVFQANKYGAIADWPLGFADRYNAISGDLIRCATQRRRRERNKGEDPAYLPSPD